MKIVSAAMLLLLLITTNIICDEVVIESYIVEEGNWGEFKINVYKVIDENSVTYVISTQPPSIPFNFGFSYWSSWPTSNYEIDFHNLNLRCFDVSGDQRDFRILRSDFSHLTPASR